MAIAQEVQDTGRQVAGATAAALAGILNAGIERFLGWPYKTNSGCILDRDGIRTEPFASVIYTAPEDSAAPDPGAIPADIVAAVIDASESMDLDSFRAAYTRIALAKRLKKAPGPCLKDTPSTTITLGIIFTQRSGLPLENFA